ncbi:hypothetical protein DM01DRAFT_1335867 [Hesseltinella vesiculosa]|uniref:Mitochondrial adapter protein MCP1 transmembrane domain-containing protein n=1 Tax=Hesseltinella vesiculosa TaxID=101127 RepID=A0A1X2GHJ2_9FUNG|nr:hypothetical protein DM01DRAFT_1335867 [Hesseltinella vesiculosa]
MDDASKQVGYRLYGYATKVQAYSAVGFTAFDMIHGTNVGLGIFGAKVANGLMRKLRPLYQNAFSENVIVIGCVLVHLTAGLSKRLIKSYYGLKIDSKSPASFHSYAGVLLVPLIAIHFYLVRATPDFPVDFGLVAWGLQFRSLLTWTLHFSLGLMASYHILFGIPVVFQRAFPNTNTSFLKTTPTKVFASTAFLLIGLYGISRFDVMTKAAEYSTVYSNAFGTLNQ